MGLEAGFTVADLRPGHGAEGDRSVRSLFQGCVEPLGHRLTLGMERQLLHLEALDRVRRTKYAVVAQLPGEEATAPAPATAAAV